MKTGIAINHDGTLCVIADDDAGGHATIQSLTTPDAAHHIMHDGAGAITARHCVFCFVRRGCVETLLVAAAGSSTHGIVEVSTTGAFIRHIDVPLKGTRHTYYGLSYTPRGDTIAVACMNNRDDETIVRFLQYESGATIRTFEDVVHPSALAYSTDGTHLLISHLLFVDTTRCHMHYVSTFRCESMVCTARVDVHGATCLSVHSSVLCCDDHGSRFFLAYANRIAGNTTNCNVVYSDGMGVVKRATVPGTAASALAWLGVDVCVRTDDDTLTLIRDEWTSSLRGAWLTACVNV
jgi:hypothetical protein